MIPHLKINEKAIEEHWDTPESRKDTINLLNKVVHFDNTEIYVYLFQDFWLKFGVFEEYSGIEQGFSDYGYCDTQDALIKYLQKYVEDKESDYFVNVGFMDMDYEKYYKNGSYINKDGVDTESDYYEYIDEHPEMEVPQDVENKWITFSIRKLKHEEN